MNDVPVAVASSAASGAGGASPSIATIASLPGGPPCAPLWSAPSQLDSPRDGLTSPRVAVVVPSNRPSSLAAWRVAWAPYLRDAALYVVEDEPGTWAQIDRALGEDAWIIPRRTDCVRMWGYLHAVRAGAEILVTLDDDCFPDQPQDGIAEHVRALTTPADALGWGRTLPDVRTRGIPRGVCPVLNHGLWTKVPDLDAQTQLARPPLPDRAAYPLERMLEMGTQYPISGMNLAWHAAWTPVMYFGLMGTRPNGEPWGVDRFGDIWAGLFAQRIAAHLGLPIRSGTPFVHHARASDPRVNLVKEQAGQAETPWLASVVRMAPLPASRDVPTLARALADALGQMGTPYWTDFSTAWHRWITLTTERLYA